jgi:hypothetical protein
MIDSEHIIEEVEDQEGLVIEEVEDQELPGTFDYET